MATHTDYPLTFKWTDPTLIEKLGLPAGAVPQAEALSGVIGALLLAAERGRRVSYSRNHNHYPGRCRYYGRSYTYRNVLRAVDVLDRAGLIEHRKAPRAKPSQTSRQSTIRALNPLIKAGENAQLQYKLREPLVLKDDGRTVPYDDTRLTRRLRRQISEINAQEADIQVELPGVRRTANNYWIGNQSYPITPNLLRRVFVRGSWECCGRAFGWWQQLPGEHRARFLLNGEPVARADYRALHGQMLYAMSCKPWDGDIYDVGPNFPRDQVKVGFQIALNARASPVRAVQKSTGLSYKRSNALLEAIAKRNAPIADYFGRDLGVRLMRTDSDIILACVEQCLRDGFPVLPVHDELIVPARYGSRAVAIMVEKFETRLRPKTPCQVRLEMSPDVPQVGALWRAH